MDAQIRFADVLRRVFPTTVASYLEFRGWIHQENLRNGISATFYLRQPLALGNGFVEVMRGHSRQVCSHLCAQADVPPEGEVEGDSES